MKSVLQHFIAWTAQQFKRAIRPVYFWLVQHGVIWLVPLRERLSGRALRRLAEVESPPAAVTNPAENSMRGIIEVDDYYPASFELKTRYGGEKPPHPLMDAFLARRSSYYEAQMREFARFLDDFLVIKKDFDPHHPAEPCWINGFLPALDAIALYGLIASKQPARFYEIGSGNSTKFAALAKQTHSPHTVICSVDPAPRAEVDALCNKVFRQPLEECDLSLFCDLQPGDILFFDGSHRILQNSDVCVFFLEVLPVIKPGVYIHLHDIFLPFDYPRSWHKRRYSEQYILASALIYGDHSFEVILPNAYITWRTDLPLLYQKLWDASHLQGIEKHGCSFWFTKAARQN